MESYSPSKVLKYKYYPEHDFANNRFQFKYGTDWHKKLGYDNDILYQKHLIENGDIFLIRGKPDRINGCVQELKTFYKKDPKMIYGKLVPYAIDQLAFYSFLTEIGECEVHLFDTKKEDFFDIIGVDFTEEEAKKSILDNIKLYKRLCNGKPNGKQKLRKRL